MAVLEDLWFVIESKPGNVLISRIIISSISVIFINFISVIFIISVSLIFVNDVHDVFLVMWPADHRLNWNLFTGLFPPNTQTVSL